MIAARPGMGKSTFALQLALNLAGAGTAVNIVSSKMSEEEFVLRLLCISGVAAKPDKIAELPLTFTRIKKPTVPEFAKGILPSCQNGVLLLDCAESFTEEDESIRTKQITVLAQQYHLPIIFTENLPPINENREDKRPILFDVPHLSVLDYVLFLYRRPYYEKDLEKPEDRSDLGDTQLLIAKGFDENFAVPLNFTGFCFRYTKGFHIPRIELNAHSTHDEMDSVLKVKELVDFAKENNMPAVALTDTNTVTGFPEFERECKRAGIKPIYGAKIIHSSFRESYPFVSTVLLKNQTGLTNLYKIISELRDDDVCINVPISVLQKKHEGLLFGSAGHEGPVFAALLSGYFKEYEDFLRFYDYYEIDNFYDTAQEQEINKQILKRAKELGKPIVAVSDARTLQAVDSLCLDILGGRTKRWFKKTENLHLRKYDEMFREFSYLGDDLKSVLLSNSKIIADQIEAVSVIPWGRYTDIFPHAYDEIESIALAFLKEKYGDNVPFPVRERLYTELEMVNRAGFANQYFLAAKLIRAAKAAGGLWNTRYTAASSFLTFCLGISKINPLKPHYYCPNCKRIEWVEAVASGYDLPEKECACGSRMQGDGHNIPFETFLGFCGDKVPDFDLNFDETGETAAVLFLKKQFLFCNRLVWAGTSNTLCDAKADRLIRAYEKEKGIHFAEAQRQQWMKKLDGVKCAGSIHPNGFVILPNNMSVHDYIPVNGKTDRGIPAAQFDLQDLYIAFCDCDVLQTAFLSMVKKLEESTGVKTDDIPIGITELLHCIRNEDTAGICQFGNAFTAKLSALFKPRNFSDLVKLIGLVQSIHVQSENEEYWVTENMDNLHELPTCRDDIYLNMLAHGIDSRKAFRFAITVRKGLFAKGRINEKDTADFEALIKSAGLPDWYFKYCTQILYLFSKAHAAEIVRIAAIDAWYKVHFPKQFYDAYFLTYGEI